MGVTPESSASVSRYYLGLDAGATKTYCLIGDDAGRVLGFGRAGAGNYETCGVDHARDEIRAAVDGALLDAGCSMESLSGIGMGVAGADLPEDYVMLDREIFAPIFGDLPRAFHNDAMGGLRGGSRSGRGLVIACGTGCICAGRDEQGREHRVGGFGLEFGDECSGADLGREGLRRVFQARDGIIPPTQLTALFVERAGCADVDELFLGMYRGEIEPKDLEPMAQLVSLAACRCDAAACELLERGGRYLGAMVNAVAHRLAPGDEPFDVVMAGTVLKTESPVLRDAMKLTVHAAFPRARFVFPEFEPVVGALLFGVELDGPLKQGFYDILADGLTTLEQRSGIALRMVYNRASS